MDFEKYFNKFPQKPSSYLEVVKELEIPRHLNKQFSKQLQVWLNEFKVGTFKTAQKFQKYFKYNFLATVEGQINLTSNGYGFFDWTDQKTVFIPKYNTTGAMNNDYVKLAIVQDPLLKDKFLGKVIEIIKRDKDTIVGLVSKHHNHYWLTPIDDKNNFRIFVSDDNAKYNNHFVKAKIINDSNNNIRAEIKADLGYHNDPRVEIECLIEDSNVISQFSDETLNEAKKFNDNFADNVVKDRKDFRNLFTFTIDGSDAKDLDDAISVDKAENGNFLLYVHIADVSHYVSFDSKLNQEALERGTSIYLVDRVIPMLPEQLSNYVCSLNPNVDRLTLSCVMEIDTNGIVVKADFYETIINSNHRLTYDEVNEFYQENTNQFSPQLAKQLQLSLELSKILQSKKAQQGYIDFEIVEPKVILDENYRSVKIETKSSGISQNIIESFMVCANESTAKSLSKTKKPSLYRIHNIPSDEQLLYFKNVLAAINIDINFASPITSKNFGQEISNLKTKRFDDFVKILLLKTMAKAKYNTDNIGHFGLASNFYTHFTSPIRRYPDLMIHRLIKHHLLNKKEQMIIEDEEFLNKIADQSSKAEVIAVDLERKVLATKIVEFMERFINKSLKGQIVSIQKFGFFVEFDNKANGLVLATNIGQSKENYQPFENRLGFQILDKEYHLGDYLNVSLLSIDKIRGKIFLKPEL